MKAPSKKKKRTKTKPIGKMADELMAEGIKTFASRRKLYGNSYVRHAEVMKGFFPKGVTLKTELDFVRYSILNLIIIKIGRYTRDFNKPHQDSVHDGGVYSFVLEELDQFAHDPSLWEKWKKYTELDLAKRTKKKK